MAKIGTPPPSREDPSEVVQASSNKFPSWSHLTGGIMGMATCEGTPGPDINVLEGINLTSVLGTPGDRTFGEVCPTEACLLCPATLNTTSG